MDHINNGPYQLLQKYLTTKTKAKALKQLKALKDNKFIDNKLCYCLDSTDSHALRSFGQQKCTSQEFLYVFLFREVAPI